MIQNKKQIVLDWRTKAAIHLTDSWQLFDRFPNKIKRAIFIFTNNIALGLLKRPGIDTLVEYSYAKDEEYYVPNSYDYQWEEEIIEPLKKQSNGNKLLVGFCGMGREAKIFAPHGFDVTGVDREPFMIEGAIKNAKENNFQAKFECADFNQYSSPEKFEIIYTSTWMYTTYPDRAARRALLDKCRELCAENGIIVISYRVRKDNLIDSIEHALAKCVALLTFGNRTVDKGDRIENGLFWKYFTEPELEAELRAAGMLSTYHQSAKNGRIEWRFLIPQAPAESK